MGVGRAAQEAQQGDVVDLGQVLTAQAEPLGEAESEQARVQTLLERLPHAQIGGEGKRGQ